MMRFAAYTSFSYCNFILQTLQMHYGVSPGDSMIMINGLMIDTEVADPYM